MANIVSASRRTDLPAFYWRWFMSRVEVGSCEVENPFNPRHVRTVSLRPDDVIAIVFWTRDARPMLADVEHLRNAGYAFYVQCTVTGYPREFEPNAACAEAAVPALLELSRRIGTERVIWRYDPIVLSSVTPPTYHADRFSRLASALAGAVESVTVSFCDPYAKTRRAFASLAGKYGWTFHEGTLEERMTLLATLAEIARQNRMGLATCAEGDLRVPGVEPARCVDPRLLLQLRPDLQPKLRAAPTRPGCGCVESVDIGAYDTCPSGCVYCYANRTQELAERRHAAQDPRARKLVGS